MNCTLDGSFTRRIGPICSKAARQCCNSADDRDLEVAQYISDLMIEFGGRLDSSIQVVGAQVPQEELQAYKRAVGKVLGEMLLEIMNPLYRVHPSLKPHGLE